MWHLPQQFHPCSRHHAPYVALWVAFIFAGNLGHGFPERVWAPGKPAGPPPRSLGPHEGGAGRRLRAEPAGMHQAQVPAGAHGFFRWAGGQRCQPQGSKDPTLPDSRTDSADTLVQTHLQMAPSFLNHPPPQTPGSVVCRSSLSSRLSSLLQLGMETLLSVPLLSGNDCHLPVTEAEPQRDPRAP